MKRNKHQLNSKEIMNLLLVNLVGKSLVQKWWRSPNKAFGGKTPISLWKGTSVNQMQVKIYLVQAVMREGS